MKRFGKPLMLPQIDAMLMIDAVVPLASKLATIFGIAAFAAMNIARAFKLKAKFH